MIKSIQLHKLFGRFNYNIPSQNSPSIAGIPILSFVNSIPPISGRLSYNESRSSRVSHAVYAHATPQSFTSLHKESTPHLFTERKCFLHHIHFICGLQNGQQLIRPANQTESSVYL